MAIAPPRGARRRHRVSWSMLPVAVLLWVVLLWTIGIVTVSWASGAGPQVRVADAPVTVAVTFAAALALAAFGHHLRAARARRR